MAPNRTMLERQVLLSILLWWSISISIIFFNKMQLRSHFPFPLLVTSLYMAVKMPLGYLASKCVETDVDVSRRTTFRWIMPLALVTSAEIGLSMCAYLFVSVTQITMVKSSAPVWQLLWGLLVGTEKPRASLIGVVALATCGLILATYARHPSTNPGRASGIVLILAATCLQGLRGSMMQLTLRPNLGLWIEPGSSEPESMNETPPEEALLVGRSPGDRCCDGPCGGVCVSLFGGSREEAAECGESVRGVREHIEPVALVYLLSPWTTLFSLMIALPIEGPHFLRAFHDESGDTGASINLQTLAMLLGAGTLVFCLVLIELMIVQLTSALTLSVAGAFKECITIIGGHFILNDRMSAYNASGLVCTLLGVHLYRLNRTAVR